MFATKLQLFFLTAKKIRKKHQKKLTYSCFYSKEGILVYFFCRFIRKIAVSSQKKSEKNQLCKKI